MTDLLQMVSRLEQGGGTLMLEGDRIRYRVPSGDSDVRNLLNELRIHREELRSLLQERKEKSSWPPGIGRIGATLWPSAREVMLAILCSGYRSKANLRGEFYVTRIEAPKGMGTGRSQPLLVETDLLQPISEMHLDVDHMSVDYGTIVPERDISVWLPQVAEITVDFKGKRSIERHTYSNFRLFLVDTGQKIAEPKNSHN